VVLLSSRTSTRLPTGSNRRLFASGPPERIRLPKLTLTVSAAKAGVASATVPVRLAAVSAAAATARWIRVVMMSPPRGIGEPCVGSSIQMHGGRSAPVHAGTAVGVIRGATTKEPVVVACRVQQRIDGLSDRDPRPRTQVLLLIHDREIDPTRDYQSRGRATTQNGPNP
jgi:hypothetical protein